MVPITMTMAAVTISADFAGLETIPSLAQTHLDLHLTQGIGESDRQAVQY